MIVAGFSRSNDLKGRIIRAATGGYWNHAWLGYSDPLWGGQWVAHASAPTGQVISERAELLKDSYDQSCCFGIIGLNTRHGMRCSRNYINKKYDFSSVIYNGILMLLYRSTGIECFNPIIDHNKMSCSEFLAFVLRNAGFPPVQEKDPELFPPDGEFGLFGLCKDSAHMFDVNFDRWVDGSLVDIQRIQ